MTEPPDGTGTVVTGGTIVDLLDRVVGRGAALSGDLIISCAGIDLIRIDLRVLVAGIDAALDIGWTPGEPA